MFKDLLAIVVDSLTSSNELQLSSNEEFLYYLSHAVDYCTILSEMLALKEKRQR